MFCYIHKAKLEKKSEIPSVSDKKNIKKAKIDCFISYFLQKFTNFAAQKTITH